MCRSGKFAICFLAFGVLLYGQTDGINVTVTRTVEMAPEEATFNIAVLAEQNSSLDDVLTAIKDSGVAAKDLTGIGSQQYGPGPSQTRMAFQFALTVPFSKFKDTLDKFTAVRRGFVANGSEMELQTYFITVAASDATREQTRLKILSDLLADAKKKGDSMATTAGLTLGSIQGINDSSSLSGAVAGPFFGPPSFLKTTYVLTVRYGIK